VLDPPSLKHVSTIARTVITPNTGVGTTNMAFGKHATQSSRYPYSILTVAGYAVDGNNLVSLFSAFFIFKNND
jgi:hypothetical protein